MTARQRNMFWSNMSSDQRKKCLLSALTGFILADQEFYEEPDNMATLVDIDDCDELPSGFSGGIDAWLSSNIPSATLAVVCTPSGEC